MYVKLQQQQRDVYERWEGKNDMWNGNQLSEWQGWSKAAENVCDEDQTKHWAKRTMP